MKFSWLKKESKNNLILFFHGWGMDANVIKNLEIGESDFLLVYDYGDWDFSFNVDLSQYDDITLVAWSMGVFVASLVAKKLNINKSIAINGTTLPIDSNYGIDPRIFKMTLDNMSEVVRDKFFDKMFLTREQRESFLQPSRDITNQKQELAKIQNIFENVKEKDFLFDLAIVSSKDRIIPTKNQLSFWTQKNVKVVELNSGHYPFFNYESWDELINETV